MIIKIQYVYASQRNYKEIHMIWHILWLQAVHCLLHFMFLCDDNKFRQNAHSITNNYYSILFEHKSWIIQIIHAMDFMLRFWCKVPLTSKEISFTGR